MGWARRTTLEEKLTIAPPGGPDGPPAGRRARGQVRADVDPEVVIDQLWGAGYHRLLIPDRPLTEEFAEALVRNLFRGIRAGG